MIKNKGMFQSKLAFWSLIGILCIMLILFVTNCNTTSEIEGRSEGLNALDDSMQTLGSGANEIGYTYKLIAEKGVVNVYSISPEGEKAFFCETHIPFSLLCEADKKLMKSGITVNSMAELNSLLQDFES